MHSLHCLNAIRKALYREYYSVHEEHPLPEELRLIHVGEWHSSQKYKRLATKSVCIRTLSGPTSTEYTVCWRFDARAIETIWRRAECQFDWYTPSTHLS